MARRGRVRQGKSIRGGLEKRDMERRGKSLGERGSERAWTVGTVRHGRHVTAREDKSTRDWAVAVGAGVSVCSGLEKDRRGRRWVGVSGRSDRSGRGKAYRAGMTWLRHGKSRRSVRAGADRTGSGGFRDVGMVGAELASVELSSRIGSARGAADYAGLGGRSIRRDAKWLGRRGVGRSFGGDRSRPG